jgi:hypothetical protein
MRWSTYHVQCDHSVKFDQAMEPAKNDRHGQERDVRGISDIMAQILAELAHEHPYEESVDGKMLFIVRYVLDRFPEKPDESSVPKDGWW